MIAYYRVERDREQRYVISMYYKNFIGVLREMHHSAHETPRQINEVVMYYKNLGYRVQSIVTA